MDDKNNRLFKFFSEDDIGLSVGTEKTDTLQDIREKIMCAYDGEEDLLPDTPWKFFTSDGFMISPKEEGKKRAWDYLDDDGTTDKKILCIKSVKKKKIKVEREQQATTAGPTRKELRVAPSTDTAGCPAPIATISAQSKNDNNFNSTASICHDNMMVESPRGRIPAVAALPHRIVTPPTTTKNTLCKNEESIESPLVIKSATGAGNKGFDTLPQPEREIFDLCNEETEHVSSSSSLDFLLPERNPNNAIESSLIDAIELLVRTKSLTEAEKNDSFCKSKEYKKFLNEYESLMNKSNPQNQPQIVIGVLGATGAGKSSLLNALINEASVLPTSGSRGCTAAPVEMSFNQDLLLDYEQASCTRGKQVPVYKADIEFIGFHEWTRELEILLEECCCEGDVVFKPKTRLKNKVANDAWQKLEIVYGKAAMNKCQAKSKTEVLKQLSDSHSLKERLSQNKRIVEGNILQAEAQNFLLNPSVELKRKWAETFRRKIEEFVYSSCGDENEPEIWPLVRKVKIQGPWSILSSGVCLVDLPGIQDSNVARAKVAEEYIENCGHIFVVAPIQRAVNDGIAHNLLNKQFKRNLLLDGTFHNVSFVCTKTDTLKTSEIMHDHEMFAQRHENLVWEEMQKLHSECTELERRKKSMKNNCRSHCLPQRKELRFIRASLKTKQKEFRSVCARVRNVYTQTCLKQQFKGVLDGGKNKASRKKNGGVSEEGMAQALANLQVFTVSANEYLTLKQIETSVDGGGPCTFSNVSDTGIPQLKEFIHCLVARSRAPWVKNNIFIPLLEVLDMLKDVVTQGSPLDYNADELKGIFDCQMEVLKHLGERSVEKFESDATHVVHRDLEEVFENSARLARGKAEAIMRSWPKYKRANSGTSEGQMSYQTYKATIRRNGRYRSSTKLGVIDLNDQLAEPMQSNFTKDWDQVLGHTFKKLVEEPLVQAWGQILLFAKEMQNSPEMPGSILDCREKVNRSASQIIETSKVHLHDIISRQRCELRKFIPALIEATMNDSYSFALRESSGDGALQRMSLTLLWNSKGSVDLVFQKAPDFLMKGIKGLIESLKKELDQSFKRQMDALGNIYSPLWMDRHKEKVIVSEEFLPKLWKLQEEFADRFKTFCAVAAAQEQCALNDSMSAENVLGNHMAHKRIIIKSQESENDSEHYHNEHDGQNGSEGGGGDTGDNSSVYPCESDDSDSDSDYRFDPKVDHVKSNSWCENQTWL